VDAEGKNMRASVYSGQNDMGDLAESSGSNLSSFPFVVCFFFLSMV